jgi:hypothetical protein
MEFEWDENKNLVNIKKHGISFLSAIRIFEHPIIEKVDDRKDYRETRIAAIGRVDEFTLFVVYTIRRNKRRIISARKANKHEKEKYSEIYSG